MLAGAVFIASGTKDQGHYVAVKASRSTVVTADSLRSGTTSTGDENAVVHALREWWRRRGGLFADAEHKELFGGAQQKKERGAQTGDLACALWATANVHKQINFVNFGVVCVCVN